MRLAMLPFWIVGILFAIHVGLHALDHFFEIADRQPWRALHYQFNVNRELNVATWVAAKLLMIAGLLLLTLALAHHVRGLPWSLTWAALGGLFLLLSLDEMASYHERLSEVIGSTFGLGLEGLLTNAWVLAVVPCVALLLLVLLPFLRALPARTRWMLLLAGAVFVSGAAGVEVFSGLVRDVYGFHDTRMALVTTLEEALEFLGVAILIHTLVRYMVDTRTMDALTSQPAA